MRVVCISDTHRQHDRIFIPDSDVLIVAGDISNRGSLYEVELFHEFVNRLPHTHKILVAGNHDWAFQDAPNHLVVEALKADVTYLQDSGCEIDGIKFWGSPWQPEFFNWAFNLPIGQALADKWALIPDDTDVLITHGPPHGILDFTQRGESVGCEQLRKAVDRIKPKFHVFGHIHHSYGVYKGESTTFINASICTERYEPDNYAITFDI